MTRATPDISEFLASFAMDLRTIRKAARLTQTELAQRLHTKQTVITRWEKCQGRMSLHSFIDYVMACGFYPLAGGLITIEEARDFTIANPQAPLSLPNYIRWSAWKDVIPAQYPRGNVLTAQNGSIVP